MDENNRAALDKMVKSRNYFRQKYQRSDLNRYKLFRDILNNYIKATLVKCRNEH